MKLRVGMPLMTKNGQLYSNAVVYKIFEGEHRNVVHVLSDFGNLMILPSEQDVLERYDICDGYLEYKSIVDVGLATMKDLDDVFSVKQRLEYQIELLTKALEGLE